MTVYRRDRRIVSARDYHVSSVNDGEWLGRNNDDMWQLYAIQPWSCLQADIAVD